eukprot:6727036-Prymnesium_polylepis.1
MRLVEVFEERVRIRHPEDVARRDARLETAFARLSHLLYLEAGRLDATRKVVHGLELPDDASEAL